MSDESASPTPPSGAPADLDALAAPGLHEVHSDDPAETARQLAADLDAELVGVDELESVIARRTAAEPSAVRQLLERRASAEPSDRVHVVSDIDTLDSLARRLAKAERIRAGTEANMVETVGQRVSGGGISVHPDSIRSAASDLLQVRQEIVVIEEELEAINETIRNAGVDDERGERERQKPDVFDERKTGSVAGATKRRIAGVVIMSVGVAIVLGALLAIAIGVGAVIVLILPIVAIWWSFDTARVDTSDLDDKATASDNLAQISARTDAVFGNVSMGEDSSSGIPASAGAQLRLVETRLELARERARSASSAWAELAGKSADPNDVDRVLRERDPQYFAAIDMVDQTSQARAAAAHLRRIRARWNVAWGAIGQDPPSAAEAEAAVRALEGNGVRLVKINTRVGSEVDRDAAKAALEQLDDGHSTQPLVLADLPDDLDDELIDQLAALANSTSVVVLSGPAD